MKGAIPLEPKAYTIQDALAELDALAKPEGVDAKVWGELKDALREALECRARDEGNGSGELQFATASEVSRPGGRESLSTRKLALKPPSGAANKVKDLTAKRETNGDFTLSWHYRNLGDYDQNGIVGVSDITPLAMHFGETYDAQTESDSIQAVIDGSGNGKIGIEDVTQLAQYFANEFALYAMQGGDQQQGPFTQIYEVELPAEGRSDARLAFTYNLFDHPDYTYWRVVPLDGANNPGEASNVVALNVEAPVRVLGVTPLQGMAGADVTFRAFVAGTGPFTYEWNFGEGATPNTSTAAQPTVTLNNDAVDTQYSAQVKVTGANGSATRHFTLTVTTTPGEPPVINSVGPFAGLSGEQLNFSADVSGDEPLTYSWEFDGGASPPVSAETNPTAILSRGGTLPAPDKDYPCRLTVSNDSGSASADFALTVSAQWHIIQGSETINLEPFAFTSSGKLTALANGPASGGIGSPWPLYYCEWDGDTWSREYIGDRIWGMLTLSHDPSGNPAVCSIGGVMASGGLFARKNGGVWHIESFDETALSAGYYTPPLFYPDGTPIIVYTAWNSDFTRAVLKTAKRIGELWRIQDVINDGKAKRSYACMTLEGKPIVAFDFKSETGYSVGFLQENGSEWTRETIEDGLNGVVCGLAVKDDGTPIVAFGGYTDTSAYLMQRTESAWEAVYTDESGANYGMLQLLDTSELPVLSRWNSFTEEVTITFSDGVDWHNMLYPESPVIESSSGRIIPGDQSITAISYQLQNPSLVDVRAGLYW